MTVASAGGARTTPWEESAAAANGGTGGSSSAAAAAAVRSAHVSLGECRVLLARVTRQQQMLHVGLFNARALLRGTPEERLTRAPFARQGGPGDPVRHGSWV